MTSASVGLAKKFGCTISPGGLVGNVPTRAKGSRIMKQLLNSSFVILCMLTLVILSVINTCQMNALEKIVLKTQSTLEEFLS